MVSNSVGLIFAIAPQSSPFVETNNTDVFRVPGGAERGSDRSGARERQLKANEYVGIRI